MDLLRLSAGDVELLVARVRRHDNSHCRMVGALEAADARDRLERLRALRRLEHRFEVDLGSLCERHRRLDAPETHPIERRVLRFVARWRTRADGTREFLVLLDRLREVRAFIDEGRLVREES